MDLPATYEAIYLSSDGALRGTSDAYALAHGQQRQLELAMALALEPKLLLLDEPMAGMNVEEKEDMCRFILDVNEQFGTTIVLIEHDMGVVMDISDRVAVLDYFCELGILCSCIL